MARTDMDEAWAELSRVSWRHSLHPVSSYVPRLQEDISGRALTFRRFPRILCIGLFVILAIFLMVASHDPASWFRGHGLLVGASAGALIVALCLLLAWAHLIELRLESGKVVIRRRVGFRLREAEAPAEDVIVRFEMASADSRSPEAWGGRAMLLLARKSLPDQPIVAAVAESKKLQPLREQLVLLRWLPVEDHTSDTVVLPDGRQTLVPIGAQGQFSASFRYASVVFDNDDTVRVRLNWSGRLFGFGVLAFGLVFLWAGAFQGHNLSPGGIGEAAFVGFGVLATALGAVWLVFDFNHRGVVFDRQRNIVTIRRGVLTWLRNRQTYTLSDVAAVQLCMEFHVGSEGDSYTATEMNLVMAEPAGERILLISHSKGDVIRREAERLAEFLGRPLLDHTFRPAGRS